MRTDINRPIARQQARSALHRILVNTYACSPDAIAFMDTPGQPLQVARNVGLPECFATLGLSISHEKGLSIVAVRSTGQVGVDIAYVQPLHDWPILTADYLGPHKHAQLQTIAMAAPHESALFRTELAFAEAWVAHEARLKCLGLPLQEWTPALAIQLKICSSRTLEVPRHLAVNTELAAAIAWRKTG